MAINLRLFNSEEDNCSPQAIVNAVRYDPANPLSELKRLRAASLPVLEGLCEDMFRLLGLKSEISQKSDEAAIEKCRRPATLIRYPWFTPAHLRDFLRFRTYLETVEDFERVGDIFRYAVSEGMIDLVKVNGQKLAQPGVFGWRMVAIDFRIRASGLIVEHYMTLGDLIHVNEGWLHPLYEKWRPRDPDDLTFAELASLDRDTRFSVHAYRELLADALVQGAAGDPALRGQRSLTHTVLTNAIGKHVIA